MRITLLILIILPYSRIISAQINIDTVIYAEGQNADQIYNNIELYLSRIFEDQRSAIKYRNKEQHVIHGLGLLTCSYKFLLETECMMPIDFDIETKDNRFRLKISGSEIIRPGGSGPDHTWSFSKKSNKNWMSDTKWNNLKKCFADKVYILIKNLEQSATPRISDW
jgi:hypothetical protein